MDELQRAEAVRAAAAGDTAALQSLFLAYHRQLQHRVTQSIADPFRPYIDPEDVLQETYVTAFAQIAERSFAGPGAFYRWMESIALSRLRDEERRLGSQKRDIRRQVSAAPDRSRSYPELYQQVAGQEPTPSRYLAQDEAAATILSCLARLTTEQRRVVSLRFLHGRDVNDIAQELGKTQDAVHMLCHRGLKALRAELEALAKYLTRG